MSHQELSRLSRIEKIKDRQLSQLDAARQLGLSPRQLRRLQRRYETECAAGLQSKHRGKASNNQLCPQLKAEAITLITSRYKDFGPTLAHEKLTERHGLKLSLESLRNLMIREDLWQGKRRKPFKVHQMRVRRSCEGELIQIDGSPHAWFEDRGISCCLLVFVDDATGKIMALHFEKEESAQGYFDATHQYIMAHGMPVSFYSDRHGIFRVNMKEARSGTGETQFSRALRELDIKLINANSPQAKGRVENKNGTLQDRLVKELRLLGISDMDTANAYLPTFIKDYNRRFAKAPASETNLHRKRTFTPTALRHILSYQSERTISKNLEVSYHNTLYQIQTKSPSYTMRGAKVMVHQNHEKVSLIYKGYLLKYQCFETKQQCTPVVSSKQLNSFVEQHQPKRKKYKPANTHPWKKDFLKKPAFTQASA